MVEQGGLDPVRCECLLDQSSRARQQGEAEVDLRCDAPGVIRRPEELRGSDPCITDPVTQPCRGPARIQQVGKGALDARA